MKEEYKGCTFKHINIVGNWGLNPLRNLGDSIGHISESSSLRGEEIGGVIYQLPVYH